jgi:EamA domain-containing membrane protein RarD
MADDEFSTSWTDPDYVAAVVAVLAVGALAFYIGLVDGAPSIETVLFVLLWVTLPAGLVYEIARQWG